MAKTKGTSRVDRYAGNKSNNLFYGLGGNDVLSGGKGNDCLYGGTGNDRLTGGIGKDKLYGEDGNDTFYETRLDGADSYYGAGGIDTLTYDDNRKDAPISVDLSSRQVTRKGQKDSFQSVERIIATDSPNDTLDDSRSTNGGITVNLATGTVSGSASQVTFISNFETVLGGWGADSLIGSSGKNLLRGGIGNDTLAGGGAPDTLDGGSGDDTYILSFSGEACWEDVDAGTDTIISSASFTLGENFENLILSGTENVNGAGNSLDNLLQGNTGDNSLFGDAGNDTLQGGTGEDTFDGGEGNDVYVVDPAYRGLTIVDSAGSDTLNFSRFQVDIVLDLLFNTLEMDGETAFIDGLTTVETLIAGSGDDLLLGDANNSSLVGASGDDTLEGGDGNDTLVGGPGDDYYVIDTLGDSLVELNSEGMDTVATSISYTLGNYFENLFLLGTGGIHGAGNSLDNYIVGNGADNSLEGGGGQDSLIGGGGNDTLNGGDGNDYYLFGNQFGQDSLTNASGVDIIDLYLVDSDLTATLLSSGFDEVVNGSNVINWAGSGYNILYSGAGDDNLTGNSYANTLDGGGGDDTIDGGLGDDRCYGGTGNDSLISGSGDDDLLGGSGDDIYRFTAAGNRVCVIFDPQGNDTVDLSAISTGATVRLISDDTQEQIRINGFWVYWTDNVIDNVIGTSSDDMITGNDGDNLIYGGDGNDTLDGGAGEDTLHAGNGNDSLYIRGADGCFDGGAGDDRFRLYAFQGEIILTDSSGSTDLVDFGLIDVDVTINLATADDEDEAFDDLGNTLNWSDDCIENASGGGGDDVIRGNGNNNQLFGNYGDDVLYGGDGNDILDGSFGDDTLYGGSGNDRYDGGYGSNVFMDDAGDDVYTFYYSSLSQGSNIINDTAGSHDEFYMGSRAAGSITFTAIDGNDADAFLDTLKIDFQNGNFFYILNYFDNLSLDDDTAGAGTGLIEKIYFDLTPTGGSVNYNFAAIQALIA